MVPIVLNKLETNQRLFVDGLQNAQVLKSTSFEGIWVDESVTESMTESVTFPKVVAEVQKPKKDQDSKNTLPVRNAVILTYDYDLSKMDRNASSFFDFLPFRGKHDDYRSRVFVRFAPNGQFKTLSNFDTCFDPSLYILTFRGKDAFLIADTTS